MSEGVVQMGHVNASHRSKFEQLEGNGVNVGKNFTFGHFAKLNKMICNHRG